MYDYSHANENQRKAIETTEGPLLMIAGPGTGKTFTLVSRVVYLIVEKNVNPDQILVATFTEKAAKELLTRISNELISLGVQVNPEEMYIGTFHSICLRLLQENIEFSELRKNYHVIDDFDQQYLIFRNIYRFRKLGHFTSFPSTRGVWQQAKDVASWANALAEELIDFEEMLDDPDEQRVAIAEAAGLYYELLQENNWLDFTTIQCECLDLLAANPDVLQKLRNQLRYIMIDEYQDTNYIQEQLVFLLANEDNNICVVGDDDQGLYRFRGATIRNILEFPTKFADGECVIIPLDTNYRSNPGIVDFYSEWMVHTSGSKFRFDWNGLRYPKAIKAVRPIISIPTVQKITCENKPWDYQLLELVRTLKESGKIEDFNQVAFLFKSVKHDRVVRLAQTFENAGISVYSPRSNEFFNRAEIMMLIGCLLIMFKPMLVRVIDRQFEYFDEEYMNYLEACILLAKDYITSDSAINLRKFVMRYGDKHENLAENTDYAYTGLLYQLFEYEPFKTVLDTDTSQGAFDLRAIHNLALFTNILEKYEYLHRVSVFSPSELSRELERFFNLYLAFLYRGGIGEYEDDSEYVPSGCVSFMTIHQSKGMEFPVVVVDTSGHTPRKDPKAAMLQSIKDEYGDRGQLEDPDNIKYYDFWRLYYTAFSRAQDLLILATAGKIQKCFTDPFDSLPSCDLRQIASADDLRMNQIKETNLKPVFSFTSHVALFEGCSLQYKFYKELGFSAVRSAATLFGTLIHQTIEDVHRAALRGETSVITPDNIDLWFNENYESLSKAQHSYLAQPQINAALKQVMNYVERQNGNWDQIRDAEVQISLVKPDYIIQGTVDLVRGEGDTVELVDFKSEHKPDLYKDHEKLERYRRQLLLYAHLIEEKTNHTVSRMHLYYTGEDSGNPMISFSRDAESIDSTVSEFDEVSRRIIDKDYSAKSCDHKLCSNCDFRHYCNKK